ncbi:acetoacetate-CoA ligase [Spizellomyces punctatus DAOM BR117]|uniref:Acetoacetate-CoA ligase n=1 Tax=Spizellomyces punctatus (strain DAOM BR117) TaxID=645134 RepID=A0A0L0HRI9_SPIPD|nr:acetoacetate-CoA ligase [Spizellomyces punctatus DAOM BR117]KND03687.1 acetoacetate-CoA ligase [Spizellomyces punctatus DAOM BR117]|eukprot:XP_016611726.1 acetoacetate-CoA ligase [Spizellomyces punctatus DAOM BR117]
MTNGFQQPKLLWKPSRPEETQMAKFKSFIERRYHLKLANYDALWKWSVENYPEFWASVWEYCGVKASVPYTEVVERDVSMDNIPKWFKGARLNFAENLLARRDDHIALIGAGEGHLYVQYTYKQTYERVRACAAALRRHGVRAGDRIAGYLPNCPETVIVFLAVTSLGAIWSSTSPDFGVTGVLERFSQVKPKILFSVNAVMYNGKAHDHLGKLREVAEGLESLEKVIIIPFVEQPFDATMIPKGETYKDFLITDDGRDIIFEQLPFYHPLVILYSSGTTGKPKCIVHSAGGILIQHLKEHVIHGDLSEDDVFFYYTTTGWMMWNWLVSGLVAGATLVLYDGSPFKPTPARLLDLIDELKITVFGTSAKYIQSLQEAKVTPIKSHNLSTLRTIYSTGSPLKPESFDYVYTQIKEDVLLGSITGGTDIVSLFAGHNAALPVYRGEIQCRGLGMSVEAWDDAGKPVYDEPGDLICTKPFPVMPVYFWNDPENEKYRAAYFSRFEGVWYHGDFVLINSKTGGFHMLGRSDGTLNPGGVRFGSAELYNILDQFPQLADTLVVGQKRGADERVILFCKMADGHQFTPEFVESIKSTIKGLLSARHVPAVILPIADIPYTVNGKKVEVAVKRIISGETLIPSGTLANPESLKLYYNLPELK